MTLSWYAETGSVVLLVAAALFCGWSVLQLHPVRTGPGVIPPPPGPVPPSEPSTEVAYLERMLQAPPAPEPTPFQVGDVVSGAARTGRALGLRVSVISRDEVARAVPGDVAVVLDTLIADVARDEQVRDVVVRSELAGDFVEVSVGPAAPGAGREGLGLHLSRTVLREQGGDLVLREGGSGRSLVARIPAQRQG